MNKNKKMNKIEKIHQFWPSARKISVRLEMNIMKTGKMLKSEKFMIIFDFQSTF